MGEVPKEPSVPFSDFAVADSEPTGERITMLDGAACGALPELVLGDTRQTTANTRLPIEQRIDALEDLIDSEIGDTNMTRARNLERELGLRQVYLKFEGSSPTGTQKDRIAFAQAMDALRRGFSGLTVSTCGNYGVAIALAASTAGLGCTLFIPRRYHARRIAEMERLGAEVLRVPGDYEAAVAISRQHAEQNDLYDANPGGANTPLQLTAYGQIAYEIYDELRDAPAAVVVPVSNGTTLAGIYRGFVSLHRRGKTSRIPRMIAGSASGKNPIVSASLKNLVTCSDLPPEKIRETLINEPLVNWHAIDGELALGALRDSHGFAGYASDRAMRSTSKMLGTIEGLSVLPASTAGLIAFANQHYKSAFAADRYVIVLTGRKG